MADLRGEWSLARGGIPKAIGTGRSGAPASEVMVPGADSADVAATKALEQIAAFPEDTVLELC